MKNLLYIFTINLLTTNTIAQPAIQWQRCLGGSSIEEATSIIQTNDGGYILTGKTLSSNGDVSGNQGGNDFWIVKLNATGDVEWQKTYGGTNHDRPYSIQPTKDGGYIVAGQTESDDGDITGFHGDKDCWVLKLSVVGDIEWQKALGGVFWDQAWSVRQTIDGGFIVVGHSSSNSGDVSGNHGGLDYWVVKLTESGSIEWQKSLGGSLNDFAYSIHQTLDGGYIMTGEIDSNNGDITGSHGNTDYWVVKLDSLGTIEWQKALGGSSLDRANDIKPTSDGGYIVVGITSSNNGNVSGLHGGYDYWAIKLNSVGTVEWQKTLGGSGEDFAQSIIQTFDGGYVIAGMTQSTDGDVQGNDGGQDFWVVKLTSTGEIKWQKTLGGSQAEWANSIQQTSDGGYILAGYTLSNDGDVSGFHGVQDFWIVKLAPETSSAVEIPASSADVLEIFPNPAHQSLTIKTPSDEPTLEIRISDLLGRQILHQNIVNGGDVDISAMINGLYLVVTQDASGRVYTGKFLKI